jgi:hypothetical protein
MNKIFYDHLIIIEEITEILTTHELTRDEYQQILDLIDKTMHMEILQSILKHLPGQHHEEFLTKLHAIPNDIGLMNYLKEHTVVDIEKVILMTANKVKKHVLKEIQAASR